MWFVVWNFIKSPKVLIGLALAVLLTFAGIKIADFIDDKYDAEQKVERLEIEVSALESRLATQKFLLEQAKEARAVADSARERAEAEAERYRKIRDEIVQPGDENEEIPPSLRRTLNAIRNLGVRDDEREDSD